MAGSVSSTRREFLKAAPIAGVAVAVPGIASADIDELSGAVLYLAREFRLHAEAMEDYGDFDQGHYSAMVAVATAASVLPSKTVAAREAKKQMADWHFGTEYRSMTMTVEIWNALTGDAA